MARGYHSQLRGDKELISGGPLPIESVAYRAFVLVVCGCLKMAIANP